MSYARLIWCVGGVYSMFLLWAIAQERLSVPFDSIDGRSTDKFRFAIFLGACQSSLSSLSALFYLLVRRKRSTNLATILGLDSHYSINETASVSLLLRYLQCSIFITCAAPFGFASLSYISYPAMVLGKSCKLIPVMLMNILLYRRRFAPHKYLVVAMVTIGITVFMGLGNSRKSQHADRNTKQDTLYTNIIGCTYLLINLALDGTLNSTQDEIFSRYHPTGQQMMFWINLFCTCLSIALSVLPLPYIPVLHPSNGGHSEFVGALSFIKGHPGVILPLAQFALTGALGQLFIFETLQHFGSLTLVTITLTRKIFTMLLSVIVYRHKLTPGQWLGAAIVFVGISVEAFVKRKDVHAKRVMKGKEKAEVKQL